MFYLIPILKIVDTLKNKDAEIRDGAKLGMVLNYQAIAKWYSRIRMNFPDPEYLINIKVEKCLKKIFCSE